MKIKSHYIRSNAANVNQGVSRAIEWQGLRARLEFIRDGKQYSVTFDDDLDEREEDESYIEKAGPGATGKYSKWAPNTADYDDDINFRKALMDNVLSDRNRRKEKNGGRVGAQVADDYMAALSKKPQKEKDD